MTPKPFTKQESNVTKKEKLEPDWAVEELQRQLDESGLSIELFARTRLIRPGNTLRRYLNGTSPVPRVIKEHLLGHWRILDGDKLGPRKGDDL